MGTHCFKDRSGLSAEANSEDSERQLDLLSREETELTEKQSRYLALVAQLEEEKARVTAARKDLTEALSEHEIFKSTLKELYTRLRESEETSSQRKDPEPTVGSTRDNDTFQQELSAIQGEIQRITGELETKQRDLELQQRHLRETEKAVTLLEKLERELENQLGEEALRYQQARRTAYLRGLFLLVVRKAQFRSVKWLLRWRIQARRRSALGKRLLSMTWPTCPDLQSLREMCASVPSPDLIDEVQSICRRIKAESEEMYESLQQLYIGTEQEMRPAALISVCQGKVQDLERLQATLEAAIEKTEEVRSFWTMLNISTSQAISSSLQGSTYVLEKLNSIHIDLLDTQLKSQVFLLLETAKKAQSACQISQIDLINLNEALQSVLEDVFLTRLNDLLTQVHRYKTTAELSVPHFLPKVASPQLTISADAQESETYQEEGTVVEESSVAAVPEEVPVAASADEQFTSETGVPETYMDSCEPVLLPTELSPEDRDSLLVCPTLKALQQPPLADIRILSTTELLAALQVLLKSLRLTPSLWDSVLDYFVRLYGKQAAAREIVELAANLSRLDDQPYIYLLSGSLGLSLLHPTPLPQAYGRVMAAVALEGRIEDASNGGQIALIEAIKAVRRLFLDTPEVGQNALLRLKPDTLNDLTYMNFLLCARLNEVKKDSMQLFKAIDSDNSGKLTCAELVSGIHSILDVWASPDYIATLFAHIDKDGSGSISRIEFAREVTMKTYRLLEKELTISRLHFLEATSPFLRPPAQAPVELAAETQAWLEELAERKLVVG